MSLGTVTPGTVTPGAVTLGAVSLSTSTVLGALLVVAGAALLTVGLLGWQRRLPRNRFAGIRTPATLRSDPAFIAANRVAAPPVLAAGAICATAGALALGTRGGAALLVIVTVAGAGALVLLIIGGLLGHRAATAVPVPARCGECCCGNSGCTAV